MQTISEIWTWVGTNSAAIQTVVLVFATIAAFAVIKHNGIISRREATIQMVQAQFGDEGVHYENYKSLYLELSQAEQDITEFTAETPDNKVGRDILLRQLNRYELIALGIAKGVIAEKFYKRWFFSQLLKDHERLKPLIMSMRRHFENDAYYCEFERVAARWNRKKHPIKHPPMWKIIWWVILGRRALAIRALRNR